MKRVLTLIAALSIAFTATACKHETEKVNPPSFSAHTPEPESIKITPSAADFELTVVVLSKACFGSAGCNLTYKISVAYGGPVLNPEEEFTVLYTVTGGDSGPVTDNFTIQGDQYREPWEDFISTSSSNTVLVAKVTSIL